MLARPNAVAVPARLTVAEWPPLIADLCRKHAGKGKARPHEPGSLFFTGWTSRTFRSARTPPAFGRLQRFHFNIHRINA
jgi:hypothetical protein